MDRVITTIALIEKQVREFNIPWVTKVSEKKDPYRILISCLLSLRTKDSTTAQASQRLFKLADTPQKMLKTSLACLQRLIYPVGFYRNKAKVIHKVSREILERFAGRIPSTAEELLSLKGVGRKTANLVLGLGFGVPAICVDTHVHRISNRLGWVKTKSPHQTEEALAGIVPKDYWIRLNTLLVAFGQNICMPVSPFCSKCYVRRFCKRVGVLRYR